MGPSGGNMKYHSFLEQSRTRQIRFPCFLLLLTAFPIGIEAQRARQISNIERRVETMNRQAGQFERDNMGRKEKDPNHAINAKRTRQIKMEIEEDLTGLQTIYNSIVRTLQSGDNITDSFAQDAASTVRKHAIRLEINLALPEPSAEEEKAPLEPPISANSRKSLSALCKNIYVFITNPIFEKQVGIDVEAAKLARRHLDAIIELSGALSDIQRMRGNL